MRPRLHSRHTAMALLAAFVLAGALVTGAPARAQTPRVGIDTHVTLSVYTCCGSLQGFNDTNAADIFSIHNIYAKLWARLFPGITFKETTVNDDAALETKLTLAVNAGTPPDMVFLQRGYIGFSVLRHLAQPLDAYFSRYHIADGYFLPAMAKWAHFGGHWWAIPAVSGPLAGQLVYLPKYMTPLGFNNASLRTFDDLYRMSKKAVRFDRAGNLTRIGYWPGLSSLTFNVWQTVARGMCSVGHGLYSPSNQPTATDPCNVAFLSYLKKLSDLYGGYAKLSKFLSGDADIWNGSPKDYMATGQALISPSANSYWSITPFDGFDFGVKGGLAYQLTLLPPTLHGSMDEVANLPSTQQEVIIPPGAKHPDAAVALSKMICWDYAYLLGPSTNGSPVAGDQQRWLQGMISGEAAARKAAHLPGNPSSALQGLKMQPQLAAASKAWLPTSPVDIYYLERLNKATLGVLYGQQTPQAALQRVQALVLAEQQRLKAQYGTWNW